jgi:CubicO group peptidase (beta-lactamase class C family)
LGIQNFLWTRDKAGNPSGMAGLQMTASDLAKVGQLLLDRGRVRDKQILSSKWIETSFSPSEINAAHGLLWWRSDDREYTYDASLIASYQAAGMPAAQIANLKTVSKNGPMPINRFNEALMNAFGSADETQKFMKLVTDHQLPHYRVVPASSEAYSAQGYLGQFLF